MNRPARDPGILAFDRHLVAHPRLEEVEAELKAAVLEPGDAVITLVTGPTGVGKTTLIKNVAGDLDAAWEPFATAGDRPIVSFITPAFGAKGFAMKSWYYAILGAIDEPGIGKKVEYPSAGTDFTIVSRRQRDTESAALTACIAAIRHRHVAVLVSDEAQHFCETGGPAHVVSLLESIKYLALESGVHIVLAGTYDLRNLVGLNAQLSRRTRIVHFGRYRRDIPGDRLAFRSVIRDFENRIGIATPPLLDHFAELYGVSNGCVGALKSRLLQAMSRAAGAGEPMALDDLLPDASEAGSLRVQLQEIEAGEASFSTLGADGRSDSSELKPTPMPRTLKAPPFKRRPTRDSVGARGTGPSSE